MIEREGKPDDDAGAADSKRPVPSAAAPSPLSPSPILRPPFTVMPSPAAPLWRSAVVASGHKSVVSYRSFFQLSVRLRVAVLLCMQRLRDDLYGDNYVAVFRRRARRRPRGRSKGRRAFQMITSDDLLRYTLDFMGPSKEEEDDDEEVDD